MMKGNSGLSQICFHLLVWTKWTTEGASGPLFPTNTVLSSPPTHTVLYDLVSWWLFDKDLSQVTATKHAHLPLLCFVCVCFASTELLHLLKCMMIIDLMASGSFLPSKSWKLHMCHEMDKGSGCLLPGRWERCLCDAFLHALSHWIGSSQSWKILSAYYR